MSWFQTKLYKSGTEKYPSPRHLALAMMEEMVNKKRWSLVTFRAPNGGDASEAFIEIIDEGESLKLNVAYVSAEDYRIFFERCGFELPPEWSVRAFEPNRGFMRDGTMHLGAPKINPGRVADFVAEAFPKLYGAGNDFVLEGYFQ